MNVSRGTGLAAAALLVLTIAGAIPRPTEAQSIPYTVPCHLSLTGYQAWQSGSRHACGAIEVETYLRSQKIENPYPGGVHVVWIYYYEMRARRRPAGGSVVLARVDVPNSPQCTFSPGTVWSSWRQCAVNAYSPTPPPLTLNSIVLMY
jgi:hypothetical protein